MPPPTPPVGATLSSIAITLAIPDPLNVGINLQLTATGTYSEAAVYGLGVTQHLPESQAAFEIDCLAAEVSEILSIN